MIITELTYVSFMVTGANIIYSYSCLAIGIKYDTYPSRLNQISVFINKKGTFYSQWSEICSILCHFMPIIIKSVFIENFITWLQEQ